MAGEGQVLLPQGKVFPKLRKRSPQGSSESASDKEEEEATDYVFRIIYPGTQAEFGECRAGFGGLWELMGTGKTRRWVQGRGSGCASAAWS